MFRATKVLDWIFQSPLVAETKPAKTPLTSNPWEKVCCRKPIIQLCSIQIQLYKYAKNINMYELILQKSGNVELGSANATRIYAS